MYRKYFILFLLSLVVFSGFANAQYIHHEITASIDPATNSLKAEDAVTIPAAQLRPEMHFLLHANLTVSSPSKEIKIQLSDQKPQAEDFAVRASRDLPLLPENPPLKHYTVKLPAANKEDFTFILRYAGKIHHPIQEQAEEYARSFSETPGLIDSAGVYLGGSTYWIPWFNEQLITFNMTVSLPADWDAVSQGTRTLHEIAGETQLINGVAKVRRTRWESPQPMEEAYLIAAKFHEYQRSAGAVSAMAFLRTPDENLANKYLETTAQYLEMYRQLLGPFPFGKFALVENFWETGYGMPSFTLLGEKVIRFPFILHSSYPHELLHNWWGNSVYVDYDSGNWCEGLTSYMADHLIKEQRGQGAEYRRSTLQRYTDYASAENDFPLTRFRSRYNAVTEAVGYGKSMMMWHMLRREVGDEQFVKSFQAFYRANKFKRASFEDIRKAFEQVSGRDFKPFFRQWVERAGAPDLQLSNVSVQTVEEGSVVNFTLTQIQPGDPYALDAPVVIYTDGEPKWQIVKMTEKNQSFQVIVSGQPLRIDIDPEFDLFRRLHFNEIPPSFSKIFGAEKVLILLPSQAPTAILEGYKSLAESWASDSRGKIEVNSDDQVNVLPADKAVWLFGRENLYRNVIERGMKDLDAEISASAVRFGKTVIPDENHSFAIAVRHPANPASVVVWLASARSDALPGLGRKLPHYGKYSYLAFEGEEPTNIAKGEWPAVNSPLSALIPQADGALPRDIPGQLPPREALAKLGAVFSEEALMGHVKYLAGEALEGRGLGTPGLDKAADYIAEQFKKAGLQPGGDNGTYFQIWKEKVGREQREVTLKNVIGVLPGKKAEWADQSAVLSAHYDHLGRGWPDVHAGDEGKIHYGADDNASGAAVLIELANLLAKSVEPDRALVFAAFSGEESGLLGSKYYVQNMKTYPAGKAIGALNLDTVGRLGGNKLLVLNGATAREWKFIFMGCSHVTGVESEVVTQDLDASDQVSFINAGVPAVQIFSGAHTDYHRPGDTADKIDVPGLVKVATFVREAAVYLSERDKPLEFTGEKKEAGAPAQGGERRASTGSMPDFAYTGEGVRIAEISPDSPAAKAGLQAGDVIIQLGEHKVSNLREYSDALKRFAPGDETTVVYLREGKQASAKITLTAR
ncbi:MAG: M28 family peptidase [Calditrichaceae bacterium]|nr:M28 family peptidase [Calditrichia bacterium]NUQ42947.1 M28 family peptidase [Calditrichaceae bacterium]